MQDDGDTTATGKTAAKKNLTPFAKLILGGAIAAVLLSCATCVIIGVLVDPLYDDLETDPTSLISMATKIAVQMDDAESRGRAFETIAIAHAKLGDIASAREALDQAKQAVGGEYRLRWATVLCEFAKAQEASGEKEEALATIDEAKQHVADEENELAREVYVIKLVSTLAQIGNMLDAKDIALGIEVPYFRALALAGIASIQAERTDGDAARSTIDKAIETAAQIAFASARSSALIAIASAQHNIGDIAAAEDTLGNARGAVNRINNPAVQVEKLVEIASVEHRAGSIERANATIMEATRAVEEIDNQSTLLRAGAIANIAAALANMGEIDSARIEIDAAIRLVNQSERPGDVYLRSIALAQAKAGFFDDAVRTALRTDRRITAETLAEIAVIIGQWGK